MSSILLEKTQQLLRNRPRHITFALIAEETGFTTHWLESLLYCKREGFDPGVNRIEILYKYLATEPITITLESENNSTEITE